MLRTSWTGSLMLATVAATSLLACAGDATGPNSLYEEAAVDEGSPDTEPSFACVPGKVESCPCPGGDSGVQACLEDGSGYEACACGPTSDPDDSIVTGDPYCGDGVCIDADENCHSCALDCGACAPCDLAPSCASAQIPPVTMTHQSGLDVALEMLPSSAIEARLQTLLAEGDLGARVLAEVLSSERSGENPLVTALRDVFAAHPVAAAAVRRQLGRAGVSDLELYRANLPALLPTYSAMGGEFPGGTMECGAPLLRLRVAQVTVHEEDDDIANDIVYCSIITEAATGSEIRVTPKTPNLDEGESFAFPIEAGVMWGQNGPATPGGNMLITYDCFESDSNSGYQELLDSIAQASSQIGGVVGGSNGWIFTAVGALASVVSSALALDSDDHLFNATQTIPLDMQLPMTNGDYWSVRKSGTHVWSDWDWELRIEAWGCAEYGTL